MKFCEKLSKQRKNNNLSQEQLAEKLGISRQAVSKWESGLSYPDMEKILQICTILNCTLEELLDDGVIGNKENKNKDGESKINFNVYLQDLLNFITKTSNMISSMKWKEKIKLIIEMFLITIVLLIIGSFFLLFLNSITRDILSLIPFGISYYIERVMGNIYLIGLFILGFIILLHLFKVRYLDYFITIEDSNVLKKTIEEPIDQGKSKVYYEKKKDKVIIRDPKHSSLSFLHILGSFIFILIKLFIFMLLIPIIFLFVVFVMITIISVFHIVYSLLFLGLVLAFLGISILTYVVIYFVFNFIFNKVIKINKIFIVAISSLILIGVGLGITFTVVLSYKQVEKYNDLKKIITTKNIDIKENTHINYYYNNIEYIIDDSLEQARIEISCTEIIKCHLYNNEDNYYIYKEDPNVIDIYKIFMKDIKNKKISNYTSNNDLINIKVFVNIKDYQMLKNNNYNEN